MSRMAKIGSGLKIGSSIGSKVGSSAKAKGNIWESLTSAIAAGHPAVGATLLGGGALMGALGAEDRAASEQAYRQQFIDEGARQRSIRDQLAGELSPVLDAAIAGRETEQEKAIAEAEKQEGLRTIGRESTAAKEQLLEEIARTGGASGTYEGQISSPAAVARLMKLDKATRQAVGDFAKQIAVANQKRLQENKWAAIQQKAKLAEFRAGGFVEVPQEAVAGSEMWENLAGVGLQMLMPGSVK